MSALEIIKLRLRLFYLFWWLEPLSYCVKLEKKRPTGVASLTGAAYSYRKKAYWLYVNLIGRGKDQQRRVIGAIEQFSLDEALQLAAVQAWEILNPAQAKTSFEPVCQPVTSWHEIVVRLLHNRYRYECRCGWQGKPTEPGHLCQPDNCVSCAHAKAEYQKHLDEFQEPEPEQARAGIPQTSAGQKENE